MGLKRSPLKGRLLVNADEYRYSEEDYDFNKKKNLRLFGLPLKIMFVSSNPPPELLSLYFFNGIYVTELKSSLLLHRHLV